MCVRSRVSYTHWCIFLCCWIGYNWIFKTETIYNLRGTYCLMKSSCELIPDLSLKRNQHKWGSSVSLSIRCSDWKRCVHVIAIKRVPFTSNRNPSCQFKWNKWEHNYRMPLAGSMASSNVVRFCFSPSPPPSFSLLSSVSPSFSGWLSNLWWPWIVPQGRVSLVSTIYTEKGQDPPLHQKKKKKKKILLPEEGSKKNKQKQLSTMCVHMNTLFTHYLLRHYKSFLRA